MSHPKEPEHKPTGENISELDLAHLIGSLVRDVVNADGMAARATADFIERVGFDNGALRLVKFTYEQPVPGAGSKTYVVSVPLLTIIPIPLLGIEETELTFSTTVVEMNRRDDDEPRLLAKIAPRGKRDNESLKEHANVKFRVKMARSDMPAGLTGIFGLLGNKIQVTESDR